MNRDPDPAFAAIASGYLAAGWYYEENSGAARLGMRVSDLLHEERSPFQKLNVYETAFFGRVLTLDDIVMLTERDEFVYHEMMMHVPLCSMPEPSRVLIVGGGDCGALREALKHESVTSVVQCDIDERVTEVCEKYFPWVAQARNDPRAELVFEDAIRYIERHASSFDVIAVDSTDPIGPAAGLFAGEFYAKVRRALRPGGVMTAQTESPHWNPALVAAIYREMRSAFHHTDAYACWMPTYPSGCWTLAYAADERRHEDFCDQARVAAVEATCRYYNRDIHRAAFALPTFARAVVRDGSDPFSRFTTAHTRLIIDESKP